MSVQISVKTWTIKGDLYINVALNFYYENKIEICFFLIICQDGNWSKDLDIFNSAYRHFNKKWCRGGRVRMVIGLQLHVRSVPITT